MFLPDADDRRNMSTTTEYQVEKINKIHQTTAPAHFHLVILVERLTTVGHDYLHSLLQRYQSLHQAGAAAEGIACSATMRLIGWEGVHGLETVRLLHAMDSSEWENCGSQG
jgi:hypothetical protein